MNSKSFSFFTVAIATLLSLSCFLPVKSERNEIKLINNGYEEVLIAISPDLPEDETLITNLKDYFTEISQVLFNATKQWAYIRKVTILIPRAWTREPDADVTWQSMETANVIVGKPREGTEDTPFVYQPRGCGEPGEYMYLSQKFVADKQFAERTYGDLGYTLLHEWGHFRWGLFDEYAIEGDENFGEFFYSSSGGGWSATKCSTTLDGFVRQGSTGSRPGGFCTRDPITQKPGPECRLIPNWQTATTNSLMFYHFLPSVKHFCGSAPGVGPVQEDMHNYEAPNKHNILCNQRSAWDVMLEHSDFSDNEPVDVTEEEVPLIPEFQVVKESEKRYVLILDISGSMASPRIDRLTAASVHFVEETVPDNSYVGIVKFSSTASITHDLVKVDAASRKTLAAAVPTSVGGSTCIGCGILKGIEVLEQYGNATGGILKIITDGKENRSPRIKDVEEIVLAKGIIADTVLYTSNADNQLISLASKTIGGMSSYASEDTDLTAALDQTVVARDKTYVQLEYTSVTLARNGQYSDSVQLDSSVGEKTEFSFRWVGDYAGIEATLTYPNGTNSTITSGNSDTQIVFQIPGVATAGSYSFTIRNTGSDNDKTVYISAITRATSDQDKLIQVTSMITSKEIDFSKSSKEIRKSVPIILAEVSAGSKPVIGANVTAIIEPDGKDVITQQLFDEGAGADITKGDGTYSAYFTKFAGNTKYTVKIKVIASSVKAKGYSSSKSLTNKPEDRQIPPVKLVDVEDFTRTSSSGFFSVNNQPSDLNLDLFEPSSVKNLRVTTTTSSETENTITLSWTAPGDDFDAGTASKYILKMSGNFTDIRTNFNGVDSINKTLKGNLSAPRPAGETEIFTISLPTTKDVTYFFALKAQDDSGKLSDLSNIVSVAFATAEAEEEASDVGLIVGIVCACVGVVAIVVIIIVVWFVFFKKKPGASYKNEQENVAKTPKNGKANPAFQVENETRGRAKSNIYDNPVIVPKTATKKEDEMAATKTNIQIQVKGPERKGSRGVYKAGGPLPGKGGNGGPVSAKVGGPAPGKKGNTLPPLQVKGNKPGKGKKK